MFFVLVIGIMIASWAVQNSLKENLKNTHKLG